MKTLIKIIVCSIFFLSIQTNAQLDTLNYIKQFETNKINYINQPFTKLLGDMVQIQPKTVWPTIGRKGFIYRTRFKFCEMKDSYYNVITLLIEWQEPVSSSQAKHYTDLNGYYFTNDEKVFYGSKIVKNIWVYR
ncbi:hypothetical protein ACFQO9_20015 [Chryseobacterium zhengzhouense]|uniref:Uncharacterized protein n=1 Tax=Chryseobacterium zhengzhouense TaxID=1636086 RepID=A0ABW2M2G4_9FLAO